MENFIGKVVNGDCREVMKTMEEGCVDLIVTSPPYGVGIAYDVHDDDMLIEEYLKFTEEWMSEAFRVLKDDGRIAINIPYEINRQAKGGRVFMVSEVWQIMKKIGYKFFGVKGVPEWVGEMGEVEDKNGVMKNKMMYTETQKREFIDLVFGQWHYFADTKSMTKATFSMDIPTKAIKILTYKNDIVLDPFAGSGTSLVAAETLDRRWIGIELSPNYAEVAKKRVNVFVEGRRQQVINFEETTTLT